jgi:transcriptional regulator with XRE-family HTH domain
MDRRSLLAIARESRGLTQEAVARHSGTSQPTLSAYERGAKSPTLAVAERILHTLDFDLRLQPRVSFHEVRDELGRPHLVPDQLWRVDPPDCFVPIDGLDNEGGARRFNVLVRATRVEGYIWLLRRGSQEQLFKHLDAALLVDAWPDVAPRLSPELRHHWAPLVYAAGEAVINEMLIAGLRNEHSKPLRRPAKKQLIARLTARGLTVDEIRQVLRRRQPRP